MAARASGVVTSMVDDKGKLKTHRIVVATDPDYAGNPQLEAQVEGSFVFSLSSLLYGECIIKNGEVEQQNFDIYPSMLIAEMPKVEVINMPSGGFWGGIGEPNCYGNTCCAQRYLCRYRQAYSKFSIEKYQSSACLKSSCRISRISI